MGGKVFKDHLPPLDTPRMPPAIFKDILDNTIHLLQNAYARVETAIEAPEKEDHGDIDILVSAPVAPRFDPACNQDVWKVVLSDLLEATAYKHEENSPSHFFAVRWPNAADQHATVEIQHFDTESKLNWLLFQTAHGDMCTIFGNMVRSLKLVINDKGLHITIPELEVQEVAKRDRLVLLTYEPDEMLEFFGVDKKRYWSKFDTVQDMMEYAASSRFFWASPKTNDQSERKDTKKSSHRKIFARWKEEFIPQCRSDGRFAEQKYTEETVRQEAFAIFKGVEAQYTARLLAWRRADHEKQLKALIRQCVPKENEESSFRAATIHVFDDMILNGNVPSYVQMPEHVRRGEDGFWDMEVLEKWIVSEWKTVGVQALAERNALNLPGWQKKKALKAVD